MIIYFISTIWLLGGIYSAVFILLELAHNPQRMKIMNTVWVLTGLWASFLSIPFYLKIGRVKSDKSVSLNHQVNKHDNKEMKYMEHTSNVSPLNSNEMAPNQNMAESKKMSQTMNMGDMDRPMDMSDSKKMSQTMDMGSEKSMDMPMMMPKRSMWSSVFLSALHCGAGCTLADIVGETFGYFLKLNIDWWTMYVQWGFDYILALMFGILFQYSAIHQMTGISFKKGILKALKVDFFSLTSWQFGMYLFIYIIVHALYPFSIYSNVIFFGFIMQLAMVLGFFIAYPVNWILIHFKVKPRM